MELHTDVPLRVHFRPSWLSNTARGAPQGYSYLGAARTASSLHPLSARGRAHQSYAPTHAQAHPPGQPDHGLAPAGAQIPLPQCNRYFRHRFSGILPRLRATEAYWLEVFEAHEGGVSQRKLSRTHRIGSATVERWYQSFVRQRVRELSGRPCPQVLGIDEHFLKLWQQYDPEGRRHRGLLSLMRRHHWKLSAVQKARLHQYLAHDPVLHALYFAKQQLNGFLVMKTLNQQRVREILPKFLRLLGQFECNQPSVMNALSPDNGVEPTIHATKRNRHRAGWR